jgi:hypothetical protein
MRAALVGSAAERLTIMGYVLLGDPSLRLHTAAPPGSARVARAAGGGEARVGGDAGLRLDLPAPPMRSRVLLDYEVAAPLAGLPMELAIFDLAGRRVRVLASGPARPGRSSATWSPGQDGGGALPRGLYFARLRVGAQTATRRIPLR